MAVVVPKTPTVLDRVFRKVVPALLNRFGKVITLTQTIRRYNELTGRESPEITTFTLKATPPQNFQIDQVDGTSVRRTDLKTYVRCEDVNNMLTDPQQWVVAIDGRNYSLIDASPIYSGEESRLYMLHLR